MNGHADHDRARSLLPWLVNGTLQGADLAWLRQHLEGCTTCRAEEDVHRLMRESLSRQPTVEFAPQPAFNRLWARIEADADLPVATQPTRPPSRSTAPRRFWSWMAAGIAAQLVFATLAGTLLWRARTPAGPTVDTTPRYVTVTADSTAPTPRLRVVFDDTVTLRDLKDILARHRLVSVSGPTPAGVFALATEPQAGAIDDDSLLAALRAEPRIRFAEPVPR
jgi:hypothetical protein